MIMRKAPIKNSTVASAMALYGILGGLFLNWKRNKQKRQTIMKIPELRHFKARRAIRTNVDALCVLKEVLLPTTALGEKGKGQTRGEALVIGLQSPKGVPAECYSFYF